MPLFAADNKSLGFDDQQVLTDYFQLWKDLIAAGAAPNPDEYEQIATLGNEASPVITGDAAYAAQGQCVFTDLSRESMASVGDEIITTGLGGVYPPDILVGRIVSIEPEASGTSVVAVIQPDADVLGVKQAFIITEY